MPKASNGHTSRGFFSFSASVSTSLRLFAFFAVAYQEKLNSVAE